MKTGERIFNLKRMFNVRRGVNREDDTLPVRMLSQPRGGNSSDAANLPPLDTMLDDYYAIRGWNPKGVPTRQKLLELGLADTTKETS